MWPNQHETAALVTFAGEILNGKLYVLRSDFNPFMFSEIQHWAEMG